jgi:adenylate cyclase
MWNTFLNFYLSNKDKAFLKNAFGNYISPELIDEMYKSGEPPKLGGTEDVITAYFTDIAGFSSFSEKLTATKLVELLNEYLTHMTDILLEEKGTLDKYEGDAIIAFFGAPMPVPDHAQRACRVASKMQERLAELRVKWTNEGDRWPTIVHDMRMRIGINSGSIVTGNMGSTQRMNYTMMGDSVNLAARLEAAAKQYGIFTQISQFTKNLLVDPDEFLIRELDVIRVVGKSEPVTVYEIMCFRAKADENLLQLQTLFAQGREAYKIQKWDEAIGFFKQSLECEYIRFPELKGKKPNPSEIYLERCEEFKKLPPPPDWDGVSSLNEK